MNNATAVCQDGPLALICGGGTLPLAVADAAAKRGRDLVLFLISGHAEPAMVARYPHHWLRVGQFGAFTRLARAAGCRDVVWIGGVVRPSLVVASSRFFGGKIVAEDHPCLSWWRQSSAHER